MKLIRFDWAIKKILRSKANFGILEGFLSELLHEDITIVEILESESNKEDKKDKFNRVDLLVKDSKDDLIIVEIQNNEQVEYFKRILFGVSKSICEYMEEGFNYEKVKKIISISILYFDIGHGKDYLYKGKTEFSGIHCNDKLELSEKQKILLGDIPVSSIFPEYYLLKINQFNDLAKDTLDEWIYFLKNEEIKDSFKAKGLKEAKDKLSVLKMSDKEKKKYYAYLNTVSDEESFYLNTVTVSRAEGKAEGKLEGKAEGKLESAKLLIDSGMSIEQVCTILNIDKKLLK